MKKKVPGNIGVGSVKLPSPIGLFKNFQSFFAEFPEALTTVF